MPPSLPALVIVNVESRSSSGCSVPARAPSARRWISASISSIESRSHAADDGHDEAGVRVDRDAEVVAVEQHDLVVLDPGVQLGELTERRSGGFHRGRDETAEVDTGEVALLDEGDGGNLAVRALDLLHDRPPDPTHGHPLPLGRPGGGAHVLLGHAPADASPVERRELDRELARQPVQAKGLGCVGTDDADQRLRRRGRLRPAAYRQTTATVRLRRR